jgi:hypothetical protein
MAAFQQRCAQLSVVVELAVEDQHDRRRFVPHRLPASPNVDDAQPPHRQADMAGDERAGVVRASVNDRRRHARKRLGVNCGGLVGERYAADAAQGRASVRRLTMRPRPREQETHRE